MSENQQPTSDTTPLSEIPSSSLKADAEAKVRSRLEKFGQELSEEDFAKAVDRERLALRAKRFGIPDQATTEQKKRTNPTSRKRQSSKVKKPQQKPQSKLLPGQTEEKLEKRRKRFEQS
ncbi:hypothetical protein P9112_004690 [Eukaryota sp. TZLM1-RC]